MSTVDPKAAQKQRTASQKAGAKAQSAQDPANSYNCDALLQQAESLQVTSPEAAVQFIDRALEQEPANTRALEMKAVIMLSLDRAAEARELLDQCIAAEPDFGWSKYLFRGQVSHRGRMSAIRGCGGVLLQSPGVDGLSLTCRLTCMHARRCQMAMRQRP